MWFHCVHLSNQQLFIYLILKKYSNLRGFWTRCNWVWLKSLLLRWSCFSTSLTIPGFPYTVHIIMLHVFIEIRCKYSSKLHIKPLKVEPAIKYANVEQPISQVLLDSLSPSHFISYPKLSNFLLHSIYGNEMVTKPGGRRQILEGVEYGRLICVWMVECSGETVREGLGWQTQLCWWSAM